MNQVKTGIILNYIILGLNTFLGLIYTPYMLRCLGQNEYGVYSLVASIIAYLTILDLGFGSAIVRFTAKFKAEGKTNEQWEMFGMFLCIYTIIGLLAFLGGYILYLNVDNLFERTMTPSDLSQAQTMMIFLIVNLAITFPLSIFGSIVTAYEDFAFLKIVQIIRILLCTGTLVLLLYWGYKAIAMVIVQTVFNIATLIINTLYCFLKLKIKVWFRGFNWILIKEITTYSFWMFLNAVMDKIYWGTGQFVLGAISGTIAVAIYSIGITLQGMYMLFSTSISNVLLPRVTEMISKNRTTTEISNLFISTGRIQAIVMFLILSGFTVFGKGFIHLWAGEDYAQSYYITLIFFGALFIPLIQNVGVTILQARNQLNFRSICYLIISFLSLILQFALAKSFGAIGCAIAVGSALLIGQGFIMNIYYDRNQGLNINKFWREILQHSITPLLLTAIGLISRHFIDFTVPATLLGSIFIFALFYCVLMYKFGMNDYEKNLIRRPIMRVWDKIK